MISLLLFLHINLQKSMDEQLAGEELEREFKVPGEEGGDIGGQDKDKVKSFRLTIQRQLRRRCFRTY